MKKLKSETNDGSSTEVIFDLFEMPRRYNFWRVSFDLPEENRNFDGINGPEWPFSLEIVKKWVCKSGEFPFLVWVTPGDTDGVFDDVKLIEHRGRERRLVKLELYEIADEEVNGGVEGDLVQGWYFAFRTKNEALQFKLTSFNVVEILPEFRLKTF